MCWVWVVFTCSLTTLALQVGRPRPDFVARCWPGADPRFDSNGLPECVGGTHSVAEGLKSFPSGVCGEGASGVFASSRVLGSLTCVLGPLTCV